MRTEHITVTFTDDIDGKPSEDIETVAFSWAGVSYEIDLNESHRAMFDKAMAKYLENAREVPSHLHPRSAVDTEHLRAIREWANANGYAVAHKGRIAQKVVDAYKQSVSG